MVQEERRAFSGFCRKNGGGGGFRTPGPRLMSPLLYHLSYTATEKSNPLLYITQNHSPTMGIRLATCAFKLPFRLFVSSKALTGED